LTYGFAFGEQGWRHTSLFELRMTDGGLFFVV
jgi:hypothetical protein